MIRSILTASAILVLTAGVSPVLADNYPWCAHFSERGAGGAISCGFNTYAQCRASVSGIGGFCMENPSYVPRGSSSRARKVKRKPMQQG